MLKRAKKGQCEGLYGTSTDMDEGDMKKFLHDLYKGKKVTIS